MFSGFFQVSSFRFEFALELEFVLATVKIKNPTWKTQDFKV